MNYFKLHVFAMCTVFFMISAGCATTVKNPVALQEASIAFMEKQPPWREALSGVNAEITPESGPLGDRNLALYAMYREPEPGRVRFALFFPQGTKIGQCERKLSKLECSGMNFPGANSLLRLSFAALDEVLSLQRDPRETYELRRGDDIIGQIDSNAILLRVKRPDGSSVVAQSDGTVLAAYNQRGSGAFPQGWKAFFSAPGTYRFVPGRGANLNVHITQWMAPHDTKKP